MENICDTIANCIFFFVPGLRPGDVDGHDGVLHPTMEDPNPVQGPVGEYEALALRIKELPLEVRQQILVATLPSNGIQFLAVALFTHGIPFRRPRSARAKDAVGDGVRLGLIEGPPGKFTPGDVKRTRYRGDDDFPPVLSSAYLRTGLVEMTCRLAKREAEKMNLRPLALKIDFGPRAMRVQVDGQNDLFYVKFVDRVLFTDSLKKVLADDELYAHPQYRVSEFTAALWPGIARMAVRIPLNLLRECLYVPPTHPPKFPDPVLVMANPLSNVDLSELYAECCGVCGRPNRDHTFTGLSTIERYVDFLQAFPDLKTVYLVMEGSSETLSSDAAHMRYVASGDPHLGGALGHRWKKARGEVFHVCNPARMLYEASGGRKPRPRTKYTVLADYFQRCFVEVLCPGRTPAPDKDELKKVEFRIAEWGKVEDA